jgi:hypothetical protein
MATITIKGDPTMGAAIAEGAAMVELRTVKAEYAKLQARNAVRSEADKKRWERTRKRLARKYSTKPVGHVRGAVLTAWACVWLAVYSVGEYLVEWNRRGA